MTMKRGAGRRFSCSARGSGSSASAQTAASAPVPTFSKDVAPIFYANCTTCHRPGEIAPDVADDVQGRAAVGARDRRQGGRRDHAAVARRPGVRRRSSTNGVSATRRSPSSIAGPRAARPRAIRPTCPRRRCIPTAGTSASPTRCCRCRRTTRSRPPGSSTTSTSWCRPTSPKTVGFSRGNCGPAIPRWCIT